MPPEERRLDCMVGHILNREKKKIRDRPTTTRRNYIAEHPAHGSVSWYGADDVQLRHCIVIYCPSQLFETTADEIIG